MKKEKLYLITYNKRFNRSSEPCEVIGMKRITYFIKGVIDKETPPIDCYHVVYEDGQQDYIPTSNVNENDYHFVTLNDMLRYGTP
jgi:hypothetical protein